MKKRSTKIKTLLIEDSGLMRILLADALRSDDSIEVIATASNGLEGVEKAKKLRPDVVITDMVMPDYDGLFVVQSLMRAMPLPIILLSSLERANPQIFDALKEGAFDFIEKPKKPNDEAERSLLINMVKAASQANNLKITVPLKKNGHSIPTIAAALKYDILTIGASTGGPSAVEFILNNLPHSLPIPVLIAQHMPQHFIASYANRLSESTGFKVNVSKNDEPILGNHVYLAPGTSNLRVDLVGGIPRTYFEKKVFKEFNDPSIDCLMESVADVYSKRAFGVILTGMGKDGALGLKKINEQGGLTISEDESTSVVYGMPRVAFETGAASRTIPLNEIPNFIISQL